MMFRALAVLATLGSLTSASALAQPPSSRATAQTHDAHRLVDDAGRRRGIGEWGFAALVEVGRPPMLFDTGAAPRRCCRTPRRCGVDLARDHRRDPQPPPRGPHRRPADAAKALSCRSNPRRCRAPTSRRDLRARVARAARPRRNPMIAPARRVRGDRRALRRVRRAPAASARRLAHRPGAAGLPGAQLERFAKIRRQAGPGRGHAAGGSGALVRTARGVDVVTGCGHAGIVNILASPATRHGTPDPRRHRRPPPARGRRGAACLDGRADATAGVGHLLGAHCTGIEAVYRLRALAGLTRATAVVGAVGSGYDDAPGLTAGPAGALSS